MAHVTNLGLHPSPEDLEGAEPIYQTHHVQNLHPPPGDLGPNFKTDGTRKAVLREWGQKREQHMHREPAWCMDQLVSGSGLYPPRHLTNEWFQERELDMIKQLEVELAATNHGQVLARDMMALKIYDIDIRIIIDDSGSMRGSMFGWGERVGQDWDRRHIQQVFGKRAFTPDSLGTFQNTGCRLKAGDSRWNFLLDAISYWEPVFKIMELEPIYYCMNQEGLFVSPSQACYRGPGGRTPSGATFLRVLHDIERIDPQRKDPHLIICLTDGEASDGPLFNQVLDSIQDGAYGDVQVLLMGLSLEPEDIKFFEDEECDDTRIRTIEAYEVEQQLILWRRVVDRATDYNFAMHSVRALVTSFFPADYDYEAPIQTLRHRLYITLHALDRRVTGRRDNTYTDTGGCVQQAIAAICGSQRSKQGNANAVEAELVHVLSDPRFGRFMDSLRPPPRKAGIYSYNSSPYRPGTSGAFRFLQTAIGALQPNEMVNRDLQFANVSSNGFAVRRAVDLMCQAVGDPGLARPTAQPNASQTHSQSQSAPLTQPLLDVQQPAGNYPEQGTLSPSGSAAMVKGIMLGLLLAILVMLFLSFLSN